MVYYESKTQTLMLKVFAASPGVQLPRVPEGGKDPGGKTLPPSPADVSAFWSSLSPYANVGEAKCVRPAARGFIA